MTTSSQYHCSQTSGCRCPACQGHEFEAGGELPHWRLRRQQRLGNANPPSFREREWEGETSGQHPYFRQRKVLRQQPVNVLDEILEIGELQHQCKPGCQCHHCRRQAWDQEANSWGNWLDDILRPSPMLPAPQYRRTSFPANLKQGSIWKCPRDKWEIAGTLDGSSVKCTQKCPPVNDLICTRDVKGILLNYLPDGQRMKDPNTKLTVVKPNYNPKAYTHVRYAPTVHKALEEFVINMYRFNMPIQAIYHGGTTQCRCIANKDVLSNHGLKGNAIDIYGVLWQDGFLQSKVKHTLYLDNNWRDAEQKRLLLRIDACLRLSFLTVLDRHYNSRHHDHYHCDLGSKEIYGRSTMGFLAKALEIVFNRKITGIEHFVDISWGKVPQRDKEATYKAWMEFLGSKTDIFRGSDENWERALRLAFEKIASGNW